MSILASPVPAAAAPAVATPKKVNLAGFAKKKDAAATSDYPVFPDPQGKAAEAAEAILRMTQDFEALDGALKTHKKFLVDLTAPFHFQNSAGKATPAKAVLIQAGKRNPEGKLELTGERVRVDFKNSYPVLPEESLSLLGSVAPSFQQKFSLTIDGDKLPAAQTDELLEKLQTLFAEYNAGDALTVASGYAPADDFHIKRFTLLTPEQNLDLQKVCPIRAAVATKNVK